MTHDTDTDIGAHLHRLDAPPHGTSLTTADFEFFAEADVAGWRVSARADDGSDVLVVVWGAREPSSRVPDTAVMRCAMRAAGPAGTPGTDGLVAVPHPFTRTIGRPAPVQDWFDAIRMQDAAGAATRRHERRWGGAAFDEVMVRVEHGISSYVRHEVALSSFDALADVQGWIDRALSHTPVAIEALTLAGLPYVPGERGDAALLRTVDGDEVVGYQPLIVTTDHDSSDWLESPAGQSLPAPRVELRMSGAQRISLHATSVLSWREVATAGTVTGADAPLPGAGGWLLLGVTGSDVAVPVPRGAANLLIETDDDGATVSIGVHSSRERERHHRSRARFERAWGRWLDEDAPLTDDELHAGIARAENALRAELAKANG